MDALVPHAPISGEGLPRSTRSVIALADAAIACVLAVAATALTLAVVIAVAMGPAVAGLPHSPSELLLYFAFPVFEFLVFTPVGWVAPLMAGGLGLLFWMARRGILPLRSPGMAMAGIGPGRAGR